MPSRPYQAFAEQCQSAQAFASAWCASSCSRSPRRTRTVIRIANEAIARSREGRRHHCRSGPERRAVQGRDRATFAGARRAAASPPSTRSFFRPVTPVVNRASISRAMRAQMPPELSLRDRLPNGSHRGLSGEVLYVLDRYLRERGDKNIKSVADLISQSTFYHHAHHRGRHRFRPRPGSKASSREPNGSPRRAAASSHVRRTPVSNLDGNGWHVCAHDACRCW